MVNLVAVQMTSVPDIETNLAFVAKTLTENNVEPNSLVVLPECFSYFGGKDKDQRAIAEPRAGGKISALLASLAKQHQCHLFAGTLPIAESGDERFSATCRYFDSKGIQQATYDKIHLFDVEIDDSTGSYKESASTIAGERIVVVSIDGLRVGVAVCYDIRFSGLFDAMGELDVLVLPAAFTEKTGEAHWESLIRARAIEKQCFVVAADQVGIHANGRETFGHSMIVSPWGEVLANSQKALGIIQAKVNTDQIAKVKKAIPISQHKKFRSHFVQSS